MRMLQLYRGEESKSVSVSKDMVILSEIGLDEMTSATPFVDFLHEKYGFSKSGVWYTLKKLKKEGLLDFTEKGEEYRPLKLTKSGLDCLRESLSRAREAGRRNGSGISRGLSPNIGLIPNMSQGLIPR